MDMTEPDFNDTFSAINLPTLPQTLVQLLDVCNDPEADIALVGEAAAKDIFIAAKILKLANSAFLGTRSTFANIEQAVIYLGVNTVRNLAISVSIHETIQGDSNLRNVNLDEFWYHSLFTALLAKELAERTGSADPAEAYLAGLLHDIGKCLLGSCYTDQYAELLLAHGDSPRLYLLEKKIFGGSHADAGAWLASHWRLNSALANAIRLHHQPLSGKVEPRALERILFLANALTKTSGLNQAIIKKEGAFLKLEKDILSKMVTDQQTLVVDIASALGIPVKAPDSEKEVQAEETSQPAAAELLSVKVTSITSVYGLLDNLVQAPTLNRVLLVLEESLQILFDCEKSVVLVPGEESSSFSVCGSFRNRISRPLRGRSFSLEHNDLLGRWLQSRQLFTVSPQDGVTEDEITGALLSAFREPALLGLSFAMGGTRRAILILAENRHASTKAEDQLESLQILCSHIGNRLHLEDLKKHHAQALVNERLTAVEEVARGLAHEIFNPLSIIQNYISLLAKKDLVATDMREELNIISREIERIGKISNQLRNLSVLPEATTLKPTNLATFLEETLRFFRKTSLAEKSIAIEVRVAQDLPSLALDRAHLRQILNNLISNSIEAIGEGGRIEISCSYTPEGADRVGEMIISVADTGPGVSSALKGTLFRAGQTTKGDGHAGLGLAIVQKLSSDLGGRIFHSTNSEKMTQFTLHLPAKKYPKS